MKRYFKILIVIMAFECLFTYTVFAFTSKHPPMKPDLECLVDIDMVKFHQEMLAEIARHHDNNRASGTQGYAAASDYITFWLRMTGYDIEIQAFDFPFFQEVSDPLFQTIEPQGEPFVPNDPQGFYTMTYSGSGSVSEGALAIVDVVMPPAQDANTSTSGCEAEDFADFPAGSVALIQRGSCAFYDKAVNAQNAGATAVIVYNEGQEGRREAIRGTLQDPEFSIPVIFTTFDIGQALYDLALSQEVLVHIETQTVSEIRPTHNIIATVPGGDPTHTLIVGAHLDSVLDGPGLNDNGSGTAMVLEAAFRMGSLMYRPKNKVTFAFWGAEEMGLYGSEYFVGQLAEDDIADIALYLNFDMVASPNYVRFVYDGDGSDTPAAGPPGSDFIEELFIDYFSGKGMATEPTALAGNSDYAPFAEAGIPIGGLFSGADGVKTGEQAAVYGGTAGEPYDANYHTAADNLDNLNYEVEEQMLKAMAHAMDYFSNNTITELDSTMLLTTPPGESMFDYRGPLAIR
jgi:Zn-dependent M28 family amino/carboxypeptidase